MGRDIQLITISGEDRRKYRDKVRRSLDVFARMLREHLFESDPAQVGLETEVRGSLNAGDAKARDIGSHLVMIGILPTLGKDLMHVETLSANARYRVLNEQIFAARGEDMRIAIDGAEQFDPMGGRPMKEWVVVPAAHADRWADLAGQTIGR